MVPAIVVAVGAIAGGAMASRGGGNAASASKDPAVTVTTAGHTEASKAGGKAAPHWSYKGSTGPLAWSKLDRAWEACSSGKRQSPIDLRDQTRVGLDDLVFTYRPESWELTDNGHTIQANASSASSLVLDGRTYTLVQLHFHAPAEHLFHGHQAAMELHLVHRDDQGNLAVVGVLIEEGRSNHAFDPILGSLPEKPGDVVHTPGTLDPATLLPADRTADRYEGSLTTPPCTEGVLWNVLTTPIELSKAQIASFASRYPNSNRPVQKAEGRALLEDISQAGV